MTETVSRFRILKSEDSNRCATFELNEEDHTLGNALRHIILKNPEVKFCGYALPHPNERKINIQIQVYSGEAIDALEKGLKDLIELNQIVKEKILAERERFGSVELIGSEEEEDSEGQVGQEEIIEEDPEVEETVQAEESARTSDTVEMNEESW